MIGQDKTRPLSNQREYDEYWSGDPAFHQPPPLAADADEEAKRAHEQALIEYQEWFKRARLSGDFSVRLIEGQVPTKFVMRPIRGDQWRYLVDESTRQDEHRIGPAMFWHLMFRCACVTIKNLGFPVNDKPVKHPDLGMIAPADIPNALDQIDPAIVTELASVAFERAQRLDPL